MNYSNEKRLSGEMYALMLKCAEGELKLHIKDVNDLNVFPVPDGDTGDNMWRTINGGVKALEACKTEGLQDAVATSSKGMLFGARGNSGVILSQFFKGITDVLADHNTADSKKLLKALQNGVKLSYAAVLNPTEGTILTVARESVEYARGRVGKDEKLSVLFTELKNGMEISLRRTPELLPVLKQAGVIDSGGAGLYYIASGFVAALNEDTETLNQRYGFFKNIDPERQEYRPREESVNIDLFTADDEMEYGYCTEIMIRLQNSKTDIDSFDDDEVRNFLSSVGDSVVYFRNGSLIKLHVHTLSPEKVMAHMHIYGEFLKLKIENMTLEHTENDSAAAKNIAEKSEGGQESSGGGSDDFSQNSDVIGVAESGFSGAFGYLPPENKKLYGTVMVSMGDGFNQIFTEMGTDTIVSGGQSYNPSAQDFIDAFEKVNAENIIVFPNNKNILLAAKQAADMYDKAKVHVIDTVNLGQGYMGLAAVYPDETDVDNIISAVNEAVASCLSGSVSVAVKSGNFDGITVAEGDYIGFVGKNIVSSRQDIVSAAMLLTDHLLSDESRRNVLTCFIGKGTTEAGNELLEKAIGEKYPDTELFFTSGGQDIYNYIFVSC